MLPDIVDSTSFRYIQVDNKYIASMTIKMLPENIYFLDVVKELPYNINYDLSMYINKIDPVKAINDITFNLGNIQGELESINKNQRNIDIVNKTKEDTMLLRRKIQVENQELYILSLIITFYSVDLNQLNKTISSVKSKFYSKNIIIEIMNFRHLECYVSKLPIYLKNEKYLNNVYITTSALANIFPFYTDTFMDNRGVIVGYTPENKMCMLDIFSNKYENANMCILGCSGSGKSFFIKLFIIRNFFMKKRQIVLDTESEYDRLSRNLNAQVLFKDTYFNILQIFPDDVKSEHFLEDKVDNVVRFILEFCKISEVYLKDKLFEVYYKYNIEDNMDSLLEEENENDIYTEKTFRKNEKFPCLIDLVESFEECKDKEILSNAIKNELRFFAQKTNIEIDSKLFVLDLKEIIRYPRLIVHILNYILNNMLVKVETIVYMDELWKYSTDESMLNIVFNMYKTIRKRNASIISITQDISDFFEYKNGAYASSILNNSCFKVLFKTNFTTQIEKIEEFDIDKSDVSTLKKGEAVFIVNGNKVKLKIKSNEFERDVINENDFGNKQ